MKTLSHLLFVALIGLAAVSCQKEEYNLPDPDLLNPEPETLNNDTEILALFEEPDGVLAEFEVEALKKGRLAIQSSICIREGESLTVYDPNNKDMNIFNGDFFIVQWKIGREVIESGNTLDCFCGDKVTVEVTDMTNGEIYRQEYEAIDCNANKRF